MAARPHLHLRNLSLASIPFQPRTAGGSTKKPTARPDRRAHASHLRENIALIAERLSEHADAQRSAGVPANKRGMMVTATGIGEQRLFLGDMKADSPGLSLLAVRSSSAKAPAEARMFVVRKSLGTLEKQLDEYGGYRERDANGMASDKPMRFNFFESTSEFRAAELADLWTGPAEEIPGRSSMSVETWIRDERSKYFYRVLESLKVRRIGDPTSFAGSIIIDIDLNRPQMEALMHATGAVIEFRPSSHFVTDYRRADPAGRLDISAAIAARILPAPSTAPRTVILDSGVTASNPLLAASLRPQDLGTIDPSWGTDDDLGHGTNMAGVALFPDLAVAAASGQPITLTTGLQSIKIVRPLKTDELVSPRDAIQRAVQTVERGEHGPRVYSLSATIPIEDHDGRQSSTSAAIDKLAWNDGGRTRLFCVAAGNVPTTATEPYVVKHYLDRNTQFPIQSPAQAVNALSVGAYTERTARGSVLVAPVGDLCPVSRTSQNWDARHRSSNKPDVVFEGGNHVLDPGNRTSRGVTDLRILTTGNTPETNLAFTGETSAATAGISGLATRMMARYPGMRAETLRGLIVNGSVWTDAMEVQARGGQEARRRVMERFGWGVPDERVIQESARNALTLVVEDELTPFETRDGGCRLKEMRYFDLPWPKRQLERMGNSEVRLTCTLSYFVEPDPLSDKRARRDRYPSHRLRFRLNQPGDTAVNAQSRLNQLVDADDDEIAVEGSNANWAVDRHRSDLGTLHQNIWTGPAHELAVRGGISVFPVKGWWAERSSLAYRRSVPFSLIVSIRTPLTDVDLYAEAVANVPAHAILVEAGV